MLCSPGIEAREGVIRMSDTVDTWVAFELFLEFTYLGDYDIKEDSYVGASALCWAKQESARTWNGELSIRGKPQLSPRVFIRFG